MIAFGRVTRGVQTLETVADFTHPGTRTLFPESICAPWMVEFPAFSGKLTSLDSGVGKYIQAACLFVCHPSTRLWNMNPNRKILGWKLELSWGFFFSYILLHWRSNQNVIKSFLLCVCVVVSVYTNWKKAHHIFNLATPVYPCPAMDFFIPELYPLPGLPEAPP